MACHSSELTGSPPPWPRWQARWALLRPGFLGVSLSAVLVGLASHIDAEPGSWIRALAVLVLLALVHAAANAWNDLQDARSGADAANTERMAPFSGGSRALIEGGLAVEDALRVVALLAALSLLGGCMLVATSQPALLGVCAAGGLLAWAYSAPPLSLMRRGWGEVCVAACWALIPLGAHLTMGGALAAQAATLAISPALGACAILVAANLADLSADRLHGKHTLVVRLGAQRGVGLFWLLQIGLWIWSLFCLVTAAWPSIAWITLLALPPSLISLRAAMASLQDRVALARAIPAAIQASLLHNLLLAFSLWWG